MTVGAGPARTNPTYYVGDLRADLIAAALEVISESGPASVSLRGLSRRLGVSHAAPANHFPTKESLFRTIARDGFVLLRGALDIPRSDTDDPTRRIACLGLAYLAFAAEHPGHFSVMFQADLYQRSPIEDEAAGAFDVLVEACRQAQEHGWRSDTDPRALATVLWSVVHGYAHLEAEGARLAVDRHQLIEHLDPQLTTAGVSCADPQMP